MPVDYETHPCENVLDDGTVCGTIFSRNIGIGGRKRYCEKCAKTRQTKSKTYYAQHRPLKDRGEGQCKTTQAQRDYQRRYYMEHREKAKEYQKDYNRRTKSSSRPCGRRRQIERQSIQATYTSSDLLHAPTEKTIRMIEQVIRGERGLTR